MMWWTISTVILLSYNCAVRYQVMFAPWRRRSGCRASGPMKHGTTHIAFIEDPEDYKVELIDLDTQG